MSNNSKLLIAFSSGFICASILLLLWNHLSEGYLFTIEKDSTGNVAEWFNVFIGFIGIIALVFTIYIQQTQINDERERFLKIKESEETEKGFQNVDLLLKTVDEMANEFEVGYENPIVVDTVNRYECFNFNLDQILIFLFNNGIVEDIKTTYINASENRRSLYNNYFLRDRIAILVLIESTLDLYNETKFNDTEKLIIKIKIVSVLSEFIPIVEQYSSLNDERVLRRYSGTTSKIEHDLIVHMSKIKNKLESYKLVEF